MSLSVPTRYEAIVAQNVARQPFWKRLSCDARRAVEVVSQVLPFKTNSYVVENLIDWSRIPDDPIFQLTFPQREMLDPEIYDAVDRALREGDPHQLRELVNQVRRSLNPHPAGQMTMNVPLVDGQPFVGAQHKYRETLLFFPAAGQTCHAYCTFCFRWPQFVGSDDWRFRAQDDEVLVKYLAVHPEISDVLMTGGDPLIMKTSVLSRYLTPLIEDPCLEHIQSIRIGTKAVFYWPQRFVTDPDAEELLRLFEKVVNSGRSLAIQVHVSHPVEFGPPLVREAIRRIRSTGAVVRLQGPCIRNVNDSADIWHGIWTQGVRQGCIPYYFFVERDTGAKRYFEVPLVRCHQIFREAYSRVSGLARTARGPSMSATPGKVHILGDSILEGQRVFVLQYIQCRRPELVRRPFFAAFDSEATWFDQLRPARTEDEPFFPMHWPPIRDSSRLHGAVDAMSFKD